MIRVPVAVAKSTNIVMEPASNPKLPVKVPRPFDERRLHKFLGLIFFTLILGTIAPARSESSKLVCKNVFGSPGDTVSIKVEWHFGPDTVGGIQFDLKTDSGYLLPSAVISAIAGADTQNWLTASYIRNGSVVSFLTVDTLLTGQEWTQPEIAKFDYIINSSAPAGFYDVTPEKIVVSNLAGNSIAGESQPGKIIVSNARAMLAVASDTVRVGQMAVVIPLILSTADGSRAFNFEITDSAGIFKLRSVAAKLPSDWEVECSQDSVGTISVIGHCDAGFPLQPAAIDTIKICVDVNRDARTGTYPLKIKNEYVSGYAGDSRLSVEILPGTVSIIDSTTAVQTEPVLAAKFTLAQNYPNPFNLSTTIGFTLAQPGPVRIEVYNLLGQSVRILAADNYPAGAHSILWNGLADNRAELNSGIYFYRISAGDRTLTRKMVLIK